jgi:hypothetical protein
VHGIRQEGGVCRKGAEEGGIQYDQLIKYCMDECREIKDFIKRLYVDSLTVNWLLQGYSLFMWPGTGR